MAAQFLFVLWGNAAPRFGADWPGVRAASVRNSPHKTDSKIRSERGADMGKRIEMDAREKENLIQDYILSQPIGCLDPNG